MISAFSILLLIFLLTNVHAGLETEQTGENSTNSSGMLDGVDTRWITRWPLELDYPDCSRLFSDEEYALEVGKNRVTLSKDYPIPTESCHDFYSRGHYPSQPLSSEEAAFPIAFANTVYVDFAFLERIFNVIYAPQNFYCYSIDSKASDTFKQHVRKLAECFPNVVVPDEEFSVTSAGHNVISAHLSCMKALQPFSWKYLITLQNHDLPLRTNAELVRILKIFNGTNDVSTLFVTKSSFNPNYNWNLSDLKLFNNETLNQEKSAISLNLTKSVVSASISHEMVDFLLDDLNLTKFINELENWYYGIDENFLSTLNSNDELKAPGGFTYKCLQKGFQVSSVTRLSTWVDHANECGSGKIRHHVCIYGVEDLKRISTLNQLFVNKMMPSFDYGASVCWLETIFNRTYVSPDNDHYTSRHELHDHYYATLPHVRYQRKRLNWENSQPPKSLHRSSCIHRHRDYHF